MSNTYTPAADLQVGDKFTKSSSVNSKGNFNHDGFTGVVTGSLTVSENGKFLTVIALGPNRMRTSIYFRLDEEVSVWA